MINNAHLILAKVVLKADQLCTEAMDGSLLTDADILRQSCNQASDIVSAEYGATNLATPAYFMLRYNRVLAVDWANTMIDSLRG